jgi:hypothetical protein
MDRDSVADVGYWMLDIKHPASNIQHRIEPPRRSMLQILPARWAAGVPHRHMLAASAFDVVPDHA